VFPGFADLLQTTKQFFGVSPIISLPKENRPRPQIYPAGRPKSPLELEARVRRLDLNMARQLTMRSGQQNIFAAVPVDENGDALHGLSVKWQSSNKNVVTVSLDGRVTAGKTGKAQISARAGSKEELIQVNVIAADNQSFPDIPDIGRASFLQDQDSLQDLDKNRKSKAIDLAQTELSYRRAHASAPSAPAVQGDPPNLPAGDVGTLYEKRNAVGSPPNRYFPTAQTPPAANRRGREMPGSDNYNFSVPITDLPGRGLDVSLAMFYNSSLWHKTGTFGNKLTFDVGKSWPNPGFRLGYGYIGTQNGGSLLLVDPDGTRHQLLNDSPYPYPPSYITNDGTFTRVVGFPGFPTATHTDGTKVDYAAWSYNGTNTTYYPTRITDRHGNYITINYQTDSYGNQIGPRITSIIDTLGRYIQFRYDSNNNLVTITAPGYANGADRQEVRFYYETIEDFTNKAKFASNVTVVNRPSTIQVIKHVFFPGTQGGYRYDYSPYGMIRQIVQLRGMTVSTDLPNQIGQVTYEGQVAATTTYDYPNSTPPAGLSAAPTYSHRTDDWAGRTSAVPVTTFEVGELTKITSPDETYSETISDESGDTTEIKLTTTFGTYVYARTKLEWETDLYGYNRRIKRVQTSTDSYLTGAKTKSVGYTYTDFNNIAEVIEYDFNTAPDTPGPILRRTQLKYVTDPTFADRQAYISRGLVHLPTSIKVFTGTSNQPIARQDYAYDGGSLHGYFDLSGTEPVEIQNYDKSFNPYAPPDSICDWVLNDPKCEIGPSCPPSNHYPCCPAHWECYPVPVYNPATAKRGNVTSVTAYADAAAGAGATTDSTIYDITGNVVTESANCCQQRSYAYTGAYQFAYPETVMIGTGATQLSSGASYDFNTGLQRTSSDENSQTTTLHYYAESLRLYETARPDGGVTDIIYFADQLFADPDASRMHSAVMTITSLDTGRTVRNWRFEDGRGGVTRTFGEGVSEGHTGASYVEYDIMARVYQVSNPYYAQYGAATAVNPTGHWTRYEYDPLGRPKKTTFPDNNIMQTEYSDTSTTSTDQAGKQRRQITDALGRVVQLDEPNASGVLNQSTTYQYDGLNNLTKITQGTEQQRYFKYDSLSRLTYERHVEHDAPYVQADATGNSYWSRKIAYNSDSLVTDSWDARGIQTHFTYDGLNRISQITYSGGTTTTPNVTYAYDEADSGYFNRGRVTTVTTDAVTGVPPTTQAFDYDRMGRVARQHQTIGSTTYTLGYSYNLLGQLQSQTYHSGRVVTNTYDAAARLNSVSDSGQTYAANLTYAGHGGLSSETWGNGAVHTMSYNERLQIAQIKVAVGGVEKQRYDYQYGEVNVDTAALDTTKNTGQVAVVDGWIDGVKQWQQRYAYDKAGRLSIGKELNNDETGSLSWRQDFTYDRFGNRYHASGQGGVPVTDADIDKTRNRFQTVGSTLMIYDAAGNLTIDQKFRGMQFTYDADGRVSRTDSTNGYSTAVYDGAGERIQTVESTTNTTRHSVVDTYGTTVADYENGNWKRDYIYRGGMLLATVEASEGQRYVLMDHQGSARVEMNQAGQVNSRHDFKPFGEELGLGVKRTTQQGYGVVSSLRHRYALTERDSPSGLDHTWYRKSDSSAGRWTSPDPYLGSMHVSDPQSMNRYTYVGNDPVNSVDPSGLEIICLKDSHGEWRCTVIEEVNVTDSYNRGNYSGGGSRGGCIRPLLDGNVGIDWTMGGRGTQGEPPPIDRCRKSYASCYGKCLKEFSFYNLVRETAGQTAANFTVGASFLAGGNTALNATSAGSYPRGGLGGASHAGMPTTWQHRALGWLGRQTGQPWIGRAGRAIGRVAGPVANGLLVFEAGYTLGTAASCAAICADCSNR
jgi:RHS repeat-associated protein